MGEMMVFGFCFKIIHVTGVGKMFHNKKFKIQLKIFKESSCTCLFVNMVDSL